MRPSSALLCLLLGVCTPFDPAGDSLPLNEEGADGLDRDIASVLADDGRDEPPGDWTCLDDVERMSNLVNPADGARRWVYSARLLSLVSGEAVSGVEMRACRIADVTCSDPAGPPSVTDEQGWVDVPVTEGFNGFFELAGPTIVPTMIFYSQLREDNASLGTPLAVLELEVLPALSAAGGVPLEAETGVVSVRVFDCDGLPSAGMRIEHDREGTGWYFAAGLPSAMAEATGAEGLGGFLNVPPGISVLSTHFDDGTTHTPDHSVLVRAGWHTSLLADPSRRN